MERIIERQLERNMHHCTSRALLVLMRHNIGKNVRRILERIMERILERNIHQQSTASIAEPIFPKYYITTIRWFARGIRQKNMADERHALKITLYMTLT